MDHPELEHFNQNAFTLYDPVTGTQAVAVLNADNFRYQLLTLKGFITKHTRLSTAEKRKEWLGHPGRHSYIRVIKPGVFTPFELTVKCSNPKELMGKYDFGFVAHE